MVPPMRNVEPDPNQLITSAEVATEHGVHVSTVARMVRRGELQPETKVPGLRGAYLFRRSAADAAFDAAKESA